MRLKLMTVAAVVAELRSGMTIGIGGWASPSRCPWSALSAGPVWPA